MNFNLFLLRLGIDPDNFVNGQTDPIKTEHGFIYEVEQRTDERQCPFCHLENTYINDYDFVEINCSDNDHITDILRVRKVRFKCKSCGKTFTPKIRGVERYDKISQQVKLLIYSDFSKKLTFTQIASKYHLTKGRVIQLFDEKVRYVPRRTIPEVLCIDEIRFSEELDQKFVCVLYDFNQREIVDLIRNRQMPFLNEYFSSINQGELNKVKVYISDMYDAYASIHHRYFPKSIHIVDLFHVIRQLTTAVNQLRVRAMNNRMEKKSMEYNFCKSRWNYFICRSSKIPDKTYTYQKTGEIIHFDDLLFRCIKKDDFLWTGYNILQELLHYSSYSTFEEALNFVLRIAKRLEETNSDLLKAVGKTYRKWRVEIANGFAKNQARVHYTNAIAEGINNQIKTIIKSAYGYHNFERFRKRVMLMLTYSKNP